MSADDEIEIVHLTELLDGRLAKHVRDAANRVEPAFALCQFTIATVVYRRATIPLSAAAAHRSRPLLRQCVAHRGRRRQRDARRAVVRLNNSY